ncbi:MAG: TetR/AcrR family transcriptional regulator [Solirubrobacteraceae bacterium]|nr:TetR/AcrR family transcriptional regulator [Solirubrobacteraceae bacterium]
MLSKYSWPSLKPEEKRRLVLEGAGILFAREGVDFPMPSLAQELGVGIGTIYRQMGSKDDILAALVIERLGIFQAKYEALRDENDAFNALAAAVDYTVDQILIDQIATLSFDLALDRPDVAERRAQAAAVLQGLIEAAKATGELREDADVMDLRMVFRAARTAELLAPGGGRRLVALTFSGLRNHPA